MAEFLIDQIVLGQPDATGATVDTVYAKVSGIYAVYRNEVRVMVQWADSVTVGEDGKPLGQRQREALAPLAGLRGEINGLIDGWHEAPPRWAPWRHWNKGRANRFDRLVADALVLALSGDGVHAQERLTAIREVILDERIGLGRVQYILSALMLGLVALLVSSTVGASYAKSICETFEPKTICPDWTVEVAQRWMAAGFGVLGAFLSLSLQIRGRQVRPDLQTSNNVVDASLRICIGALSAVTLAALLQSRLIGLQLNGASLAGGAVTTPLLIVASIAAGFTERLVSDVIAQVGPRTPSVLPQRQGAQPAGGEHDPGARAPKPPPAPAPLMPPEDDDAEGCLDGHDDADAPATDDTELPEATGGVAGG